MKYLLIAVSVIGLLLTVVPSFLVYSGIIAFPTHKTVALIGTILWLTTAPFWMNKRT